MIVNLLKNNSANNVLNKNLELITSINVNFKYDLDVSSPEIKLIVGNMDFNIINYVEIPELNRSYFIERTSMVNNKIIIIYLICDLLVSFKSDILKSNALFRRSIKNGDYVNIQETNKYTQSVRSVKSDYVYNEGETLILTSVRGV